MRDDDGGAVVHQRLERILNEFFGLGVERRSRLVEQQQRRAAEQRAGDCNTLTLAARQAGAPFALSLIHI